MGELNVLGIPIKDVGKLNHLTNQEFAEWHTSQMESYDFWKRVIPRCTNCSNPIPEPKHMRRYLGQTLDAHCFEQVYIKDRHKLSHDMKKYFDLVLTKLKHLTAEIPKLDTTPLDLSEYLV